MAVALEDITMTVHDDKTEGSETGADTPVSTPRLISSERLRCIKNEVKLFLRRCRLLVKIVLMITVIYNLHIVEAIEALFEQVSNAVLFGSEGNTSPYDVIINYAKHKAGSVGKLAFTIFLSAYALRGEIVECIKCIKRLFGKR